MKKMNSTSFQGLEIQKTLESFWQKEEEEEVQRDSEINVEKLLVYRMNWKRWMYRLIDKMQNKALLL